MPGNNFYTIINFIRWKNILTNHELYTVPQSSLIYWYLVLGFCLCTLYEYLLIVYYELISFPCTNLMSYLCIIFIKLLLFLFYYRDPLFTENISILKSWNICYCLSVCGRILPQWNFTPTGFNTIHWTKENCFCKTALQLEPFKISNNEMICLLGIGNITEHCVCVCVCGI